MRLTRRQLILGGAATAAGLTGVAALLEPLRVTVEHHRIFSRGAELSTRPVRIVQLSDLHLQTFDSHARAVVTQVNELDADLLTLTGDAIDRADRIPVLHAFLEDLSPRSVKLATVGNWEHWAGISLYELRSTYAAHGWRLLVNESVALESAGAHLVVTGFDDSTGGRPDPAMALEGIPSTPNHILLAHSPAYRDALSTWLRRNAPRVAEAAVCVLSGHTHGGQVNLFGWAPVRPRGSGPYVSGWYRNDDPPLYVSRGVGTSIMRVRLGSPPEISSFEWHVIVA